jgi:hypothetical protein
VGRGFVNAFAPRLAALVAVAICMLELKRDTRSIGFVFRKAPRATQTTIVYLCLLDAGVAGALSLLIDTRVDSSWWWTVGAFVPGALSSRLKSIHLRGREFHLPGALFWIHNEWRSAIGRDLAHETARQIVDVTQQALEWGYQSSDVAEWMRIVIAGSGGFLSGAKKRARQTRLDATMIANTDASLQMRRLIELAFEWRETGVIKELRDGTFRPP